MLPRFSGERLDLIVDYLTYVAVPAYALTEAPLLPDAARLPAAAAILLSSLFHVADLKSKTEEGYFVGFPAIWNIVLLYLFALGLPPYVALAVVGVFVARHLRADPGGASVSRRAAAPAHLPGHPAMGAEPPPPPSPIPFHRRSGCKSLLVATALYFAGLGLYRSLA